MSKAFKCDKCGDLVAEAKSCNTFAIQNYIYLNNQYQSNSGESIDLCIHCEVKVFEDILEELKGELPKMDEEDLIGITDGQKDFIESYNADPDEEKVGTKELLRMRGDRGRRKVRKEETYSDNYSHDNDDPDDLDLCK